MSAAGVVQQKQRLRNHGVVQEAACKSVEAPMAKFFDEMLAHVRSLTGMRIPFFFVSTAFAGMINFCCCCVATDGGHASGGERA